MMTKIGAGEAARHAYDTTKGRYVLTHTGEVEVLIDIPTVIRAMGAKALQSRRGVSKLMDGAILVRVTKRGQP